MSTDSGLLIRANLHTHSHASAGELAPFDHNLSPDAPDLVNAAAGYHLDCVAITDHAEQVSQPEWAADAAAAAGAPSGLVAMRGFEWTHVTATFQGDHVNVFGTTEKVNASGGAWGPTVDALPKLYDWLTTATSCYDAPVVAQLNHLAMPGPHFDDFAPPTDAAVRDIVTLAELAVTRPLTPPQRVEPLALTWKPFPFNIRDGEAYWRKALERGWRVAPTLNADNDGILEPSARRFHTGIFLKPGATPSPQSVLEALAARRTFASQDADAEIQLWHGDSFMGSVGVAVPPGSSFRLMYRHPEDGTIVTHLDAADSVIVVQGAEHPLPPPRRNGGYWVWDIPAPSAPAEYCIYARLRQSPELGQLSGGDYIFSAPIWCTVPKA